MPKLLQTLLLLCCSNLLMAFAWYGPLHAFKTKPLLLVVLMSWGIAFFEYLIAVPANRIGSSVYTISQLKILQECVSLSVFVPFALFFLKSLRLNCLDLSVVQTANRNARSIVRRD